MRAEEFNRLLDRRIDRIKAVLAFKASEYSSSADRLHNFKASADLANECVESCSTPSDECAAFMRKHIVSVFDLVADGSKTLNGSRRELLDEKIGDAINYLILLEACEVERMG